MARQSVIEKYQLGPRVETLSYREGKSDTEIARILKAEGFRVSQPTVSRYLRDVKQTAAEEVTGIIQEHLGKELPKDLDVLEKMEALTYAWAMEKDEDVIEQISDRDWFDGILPVWRKLISGITDEESKELAMGSILREALAQVLRFLDIRKRRLYYIKSTRDAIALKLQYSGVIDSDKSGNIVIMTSERKDQGPGSQDGGQKPAQGMRLVGGKSDAR